MTVASVLSAALCAIALAAAAPPDYVRRGDEVEKAYESYTTKLAAAYATLKADLRRDVPEFFHQLNPVPPKPIVYGYQVVPKLTREAAPGERRDSTRAVSTSYSWPLTLKYIEIQLPRVAEMEEQLAAAQSLALSHRRAVYKRWLTEYGELEANQRLVDTHIQYNRFWQKSVADDRAHYARLTLLHDRVLVRQAVQDALNAKDDAAFTAALSQIQEPGIDRYKTRKELEPDLRILEKLIASEIHAGNNALDAPDYIRVTHPGPTVWELWVRVYTDIADQRFVREAKAAIEKAWTIDERENTYRMHVDFRYVSPARLYRGRRPPARGAAIDVPAHAALFPRDGGVLTTGTNSTYAIPGEYVALGPQTMSYNVMAHEFGHLLGFVDGYFRGFHDLGSQGYEVIEVVPDPTDIMSTPSSGHVQAWEYQRIIASLTRRRGAAPKKADATARTTSRPFER